MMQPPEVMRQINKKITKFPLYVAENFIYEPVEFSENNEIANLIKNLYYADQYFDFLRALKYAEQCFLTKNVLEITVEQLEEFFYTSHAIIAKSVTFFSAQGAMSGLTIERRMPIVKETGRQGLKYECNSKEIFSQHNYNILVQLYGKDDADLYKDFCALLEKAYEKECLRIAPNNKPTKDEWFQIVNINKYDLIMNDDDLKVHKGFEIFLRIFAYSAKPEDISGTVKLLCQNVVKKIQFQEKPSHIAATIILVARPHPFWNGTGRHVRFFANCILMLLSGRPINLDKYKQKFYTAIEHPTQDIVLIENLIEQCIEDVSNENLDEHAIVEDDDYRAYWPQGTDNIVVEYDDYMDIVEKANFQPYKDVASRMSSPKKSSLDKERYQFVLQNFVRQRIDEETLVLLAIACKKMNPIFNMYCIRKAGDFYLKKGDSKILGCYIDILNYAKKAGYYETAYNYTLMALKISQAPEQIEQLKSLLETLNCVAKRRNKLGLKINPIQMEEKIGQFLRNPVQNIKVIPNISAVINPQQNDELKQQLKRITQQDWRVNLEQQRAIYISPDAKVVEQIFEHFERHHINVKKGKPKGSADSMVEINTMKVDFYRNIPPISVVASTAKVRSSP